MSPISIENTIREVRIYSYPGCDDFTFDNVTMFQTLYLYRNRTGLTTYVFNKTFESAPGILSHSYAFDNAFLDIDEKVLNCYLYPGVNEYNKRPSAGTDSP